MYIPLNHVGLHHELRCPLVVTPAAPKNIRKKYQQPQKQLQQNPLRVHKHPKMVEKLLSRQADAGVWSQLVFWSLTQSYCWKIMNCGGGEFADPQGVKLRQSAGLFADKIVWLDLRKVRSSSNFTLMLLVHHHNAFLPHRKHTEIPF